MRCEEITDQGLNSLSEGLKRLNRLQSISLLFFQSVFLSDEFVDLLLGAAKSQLKAIKILLKGLRALNPYNIFTSVPKYKSQDPLYIISIASIKHFIIYNITIYL